MIIQFFFWRRTHRTSKTCMFSLLRFSITNREKTYQCVIKTILSAIPDKTTSYLLFKLIINWKLVQEKNNIILSQSGLINTIHCNFPLCERNFMAHSVKIHLVCVRCKILFGMDKRFSMTCWDIHDIISSRIRHKTFLIHKTNNKLFHTFRTLSLYNANFSLSINLKYILVQLHFNRHIFRYINLNQQIRFEIKPWSEQKYQRVIK